MKRVFHLLPNAHIDPVWFWDWREGSAEAVSTCRTMVELMRRNPQLTFIRGEAWVYREVERQAPALLDEIRGLIAAGRWDVVGGNWVQVDTNLPSTPLFLRQYEYGQQELERLFGRRVRAAWAADTFGQARGLPEILAASGLKYYAFGRPEAWIYPMRKPLFFWKGQGGSEILAHRTPLDWYASERHGLEERLDNYQRQAAEWDLENVAVLFGLGDHGGGASQRHIDDVTAWAARHPEVEVRFSTLHAFFAAAEAEVNRRGRDLIDTIEEEINFLQRGYYSSAARIKYPYRDTEAALRRASAVAAVIGEAPGDPERLDEAWQGCAFNAFHDILPGTIIERASDQQIAWMGGVRHQAEELETRALQRLIARIDTAMPAVAGDMPQAVPVLVFNPRPEPYRGPVEFEASLDYRPIWKYQDRDAELPVELRDAAGRPLPFQAVENEHHSLEGLPWRRRVVFQDEIPACGWKLYSLGYVENPASASLPPGSPVASSPAEGVLANGRYRVETELGSHSIRIFRDGEPLFDTDGLRFATYADYWGSWGSIKEEPEAYLCPDLLENWRVTGLSMLESGPERARLWCRFAGEKSHLEAIVSLYRDRDAADLELRILWNERASRLRCLTGRADSVEYQVPGGSVKRSAAVQGDVPGGRWLVWERQGRRAAIATDHLCGFAAMPEAYSLTLIRGNRYCTDITSRAEEYPHRPANDQGEHRLRLTLTGDAANIRRLAGEQELPLQTLLCDRHAGSLPRSGSLLRVEPSAVEVLDIRRVNGALRLTLQNQSPEEVTASVHGEALKLPPWRIIRHEIAEK